MTTHQHDYTHQGHKQCNHHHSEEHDHIHDHSHGGKTAIILYIIGLVSFIIGFWVESHNEFVAVMAYLISVGAAGYHIIIEGVGDTIRQSLEARKFVPNVHFLMALATLGAILIRNYEEAALLIVIFAGAHFLEEYVDNKSKREITNLLNLNPTEARILHSDGSVMVVPVDQVKVGDTLQVLNGAQVPTDGVIVSGSTAIDEASINGESIPKEKNIGDEVYAATLNGSGTFTMTVTKDSSETVFAKILDMVKQSQQSLTKTGTLIQRLEPKYVSLVLVLYPFVLLLGLTLFGWDWDTTLYRSMVYLISVSPCALAASAVPVTLATISNLSKRGVLVKGGSYLSKLQELQAVAFDKTGTLTEGKPVVTDVVWEEAIDKETVTKIIVAMERQSNHPLATAIINYYPGYAQLDIDVTNELGRGLSAHYEDKVYRVGKPDTFTSVPSHMEEEAVRFSQDGKTVIFVAIEEQVIGLIALMDIPNEAAKEAISYFKQAGIHTTMITGDAKLTGEAVGRLIGIDEVIANVMPEDKAVIIQRLHQQYGTVSMLGDGVNDAPALAVADVGIAMGEGTDAAMEVADLVLMKNDLSKLTYAHRLAKKMNRVTWQNIWFSLAIVGLLVTLNFLGKMDITIGVIAHEGSTILVILNALRLLRGIE